MTNLMLIILLLNWHRGESREKESISTNKTLLEGEYAILTCPFDVNHSFWEKSNEVISDDNGTFDDKYRIIADVLQVGYKLEIINITTNDSDVYLCTNKNDLAYHQVTLLVKKRPDVWIDNLENGLLYCNTTRVEFMDTNIRWEHRSVFNEPIRNLNSSTDGYVNLNETGLFKNYEKNGVYMCSVVDTNGTITGRATTNVTEFGKPACIGNPKVKSDSHICLVTISISFYSVPEYNKIMWMIGDKIVDKKSRTYQWSDKKTKISTQIHNSQVHLNGSAAILKILTPAVEELTKYSVYISNAYGDCNCTVQQEDLQICKNITPAKVKRIPAIAVYVMSCGGCVGVLLLLTFLYSLYKRHQRQLPVKNINLLDLRTTEVSEDTQMNTTTTQEVDLIQLAETYTRVMDTYEETTIPFTDEIPVYINPVELDNHL